MHLKKLSARMLTITAAAGLALGASSGSQAGSANSNLLVSATVSANCAITTAPVAFGAYDPVTANATTALTTTGTVTVTCTQGSTGTITLSQGANPGGGSTDIAPARQLKDAGTDVLAYSLSQDSGHTTVWGNTAGTGVASLGTGTTTALTVYGSVAAGQNVPAGSYTDTVVALVTF
jgi:spore coat protein U-like protein